MKIALVITGLGVGGAERVVLDLADGLAEKGHAVKIFFLTGDALLRPKNSAISITGLGLDSYIKCFHATFLLIRALRAFKPDVVHTHLFHAGILARLIRPFIGVRRLITTVHILRESRFRMLVYRMTDWLADITTNVCEEAVNSFIKGKASKPNRILAVHNGISTSRYQRFSDLRLKVRSEFCVSEDQILILAVGRLHEQKDYPNLLTAISRLNSDPSKYFIIIAGSGHLNDFLLNLSEKLGVSDRVKFIGLRRDIPGLMSAADVFVLSSEMEGFPMVVGEAMSSQCLVIGTDCGGVKEFLGDSGFLVPPKAPDDLARKLDYALSMPEEEREDYGRLARARIEKFYSIDIAVNKWISLYSSDNFIPNV